VLCSILEVSEAEARVPEEEANYSHNDESLLKLEGLLE
jgi:hypothetical protein